MVKRRLALESPCCLFGWSFSCHQRFGIPIMGISFQAISLQFVFGRSASRQVKQGISLQSLPLWIHLFTVQSVFFIVDIGSYLRSKWLKRNGLPMLEKWKTDDDCFLDNESALGWIKMRFLFSSVLATLEEARKIPLSTTTFKFNSISSESWPQLAHANLG